jgi:hypothetical protein
MVVTTCPECGGAMEPGFVADLSGDTVMPSEWIGGTPERSWFTGTRLRGKARAPLTALRCDACGFVKLYAPASAVAAHTQLAARVDQLEAELARLAERERFLMELLQRGHALPPMDAATRPDAPGDPHAVE